MAAELPVPDFDRGILDLRGVSDAGVVEQDVEAGMGLEGGINDLRPVMFRSDVEMHVARVMALRIEYKNKM